MNILIINAHSALNLGDEGIMRATLQGLDDVFPGAHITIAANDPESWRKFEDVEVVGSLCNWVADCRLGNWGGTLVKTPFYLILLSFYAIAYRIFGLNILWGVKEKKQLLAGSYQADLVLSCGGGNLYANHSRSPSFFWHLMSLLFPLALGKKTILLPQSVGPINGRFLQTLTRFILSRFPIIMVREPTSLNYVRKTLQLSNQVELLPDIAFSLSDDSEHPQYPVSPGLNIGITVMDRGSQTTDFQGQANYEDVITNLLLKLIEDYDAHIHIFVQVYGPSKDQDDRYISQRIYQCVSAVSNKITLIDTFSTALEAKSAYAQMDCMIATRMHTAIFALGNNVPVVLIGYQPKSQGMLEFLSLAEYGLNIEEITQARLVALVENVINERSSIKQQINLCNQQMEPSFYGWKNQLTH